MWKNSDKIEPRIGAIPRTLDVVIYSTHGGSVSDNVVDRLQAEAFHERRHQGLQGRARENHPQI